MIAFTPCISIVMYSALPLESIGSKVVKVIEHFLEFIPAGLLLSQYILDEDEYAEGYFSTFDKAAAAQLLEELSRFEYYTLWVCGEPDGEPTGYGIWFYGAPLDADELPDATNVIRLDVPLAGSKQHIANLLRFATESFDIFPAFAGLCGHSFNYDVGASWQIRPQINELLMSYIGFDNAYNFMNYDMKGKCPPPSWLTFVGDELLAKLGGRRALATLLDDVPVRELEGGMLIQAAARPPVGDVNRRARDIGALPKIARILKPLRIVAGEVDLGFGDSEDRDQARRWLARFDDLEDQPWNNWAIDEPASSGGT